MSHDLGNFRPKNLNQFIGFDDVKRNLAEQIEVLNYDVQRAIEQDRRNGPNSFDSLFVSCPHILMMGLPGFGKTTLAELYAAEMSAAVDRLGWPRCPNAWTDDEVYRGTGAPDYNEQYRFARLDATTLEDWETLDAYLYEMQPYGVILIDEIHNLRPSLQEHLLELLHDGTWQSVRGGRRFKHYGWTLIGTTTDESRLRDAFRSRFHTVINLREYSPEDLNEIVQFTAERAGIDLTEDAVAVIAERGRGTPRDIVKIVRKLRDLSVIERIHSERVDESLAIKAAERLGYGPHGFSDRDIKVLRYIRDYGPIGAKTLTNALGFGSEYNYGEAEEFLVRSRLIIPRPRGRELSPEGKRLVETF